MLRVKACIPFPLRGKVIFLSNAVQNVNKINTGLCPHGLPPGACPICSQGAGSMKQSDRNRKIGEMTYHECAMIGNMLKARALAQKNHEQNIKQHLENVKNFQATMEKLSVAMQEFIQKFSNILPLKPVVFVIQHIAIPIVNFIQKIPVFIKNIKFEIIDKLNAIFGEAKAFVDKKISELVSFIKNKLFKIFKKNNADDEDTKIDDDKKIFNLKTLLQKVLRKKKKKDVDDSEDK